MWPALFGVTLTCVPRSRLPRGPQVSVPLGALDLMKSRAISVGILVQAPFVTSFVQLMSFPLVFSPSGLKFLAPVVVILQYSASGIPSRRLLQTNGVVMVHKPVSDGFLADGVTPDPNKNRWQPVAPSQLLQPAPPGLPSVICQVTGFSTLAPILLTGPPTCVGAALPKTCAYRYPHDRASSAGMEVYIGLAAACFLWLLIVLVICLPGCCKGPKYVEEPEESEEKPWVAFEPLPISPLPPPAPIVFVREVEPERRFNENGLLIKHYGEPIHRKPKNQ